MMGVLVFYLSLIGSGVSGALLLAMSATYPLWVTLPFGYGGGQITAGLAWLLGMAVLRKI